ncbi:hypothetical protein Goari_026810 [Gossypium aridum]|uniref:Reverse transcriptase zinc-binding domain-containing protein n=1 Tax=Gossypium aridum TaxID=34290 RepID=A0A7J8YTD7_GOSAI|nr:hypothetical protein [Gossypium aridum]
MEEAELNDLGFRRSLFTWNRGVVFERLDRAIVKLDLENAYDRVRWDFIDASFRAVIIPDLLCNAIMSSISSSTLYIIWNVTPAQKFLPVRGVGVEDSIADGLCNILKFRKVYCLGKYLGVPFFHNKITASTLRFVVNKVRSRFESWDVRKLSLAGRATLAQSVLITIPILVLILKLFGYRFYELCMECLVDCLSQYRVVDVHSCGKPLQEHDPLFKKTFFGNLIPGHSNLDMDCVLSDMVSGNGPQRVWFFIWLLLKYRLFTKEEIVRKGFGHDLNCGVCGNVSKDVLHVLRDCSTARNIWNLLVPYDWLTNFYSSSLQNWLVLNLQGHQDWYVRDIDWKCLFEIIAWRLWKILTSLFFRGLHGMLTKSSKYHSVMQDSISPTTRKHQSGQK